jgi:TolB-like protein
MFNLKSTARTWILCLALAVLAKPLPAFELEIEEISRSVAGALQEAGKTRVAVVDFTDIQGRPDPLGRFLAEELSVALVSVAVDFRVVDRLHLQTILSENEIQRAGVFERDTTRKLLALTEVDALVTGRLTPSSTRIRMTVKVLDTDTASLLGAVSVSIERDELIDELLAISGNDLLTEPFPPRAPEDLSAEPEHPADESAAPLSRSVLPVSAQSPPKAPAIGLPPPSQEPEGLGAAAAPPIETAPDPPTPRPKESEIQDLPGAPAESPAAVEPAVPIPVSAEPPRPQTGGIGIAVPEPITVAVQALRIIQGRAQVTLTIQNNTATELEWRAGRDSRISDSQGRVLTCIDCPTGVDDGAVNTPARADSETTLRFTPDSKAAALRRRDAFAFFFSAESGEAGSLAGPFTLFLEYELLGSGGTKSRQANVVFTDLLAEAADK